MTRTVLDLKTKFILRIMEFTETSTSGLNYETFHARTTEKKVIGHGKFGRTTVIGS